MKFWPFPLLRNYSTNHGLSELFIAFAHDGDLSVVKTTKHEITIASSLGTIEIWNSNKWYAWASQGSFKNISGDMSHWIDEMPSRYAVREMRKALDRCRFGIPEVPA